LEASFVVGGLDHGTKSIYLVNNAGICSSCQIKWARRSM